MLHTKILDSAIAKIEIAKAEKFISSSKFGASIFFIGTVRDFNEDKKVTGITYDSHDALVIKSFEEIYNEADDKLKIKDKAVFIEHIKGYVKLGEISIIIAVGPSSSPSLGRTEHSHISPWLVSVADTVLLNPVLLAPL